MAHTSGTYQATAVTTRQWFGFRLASMAMWLSFMLALYFSVDLMLRRAELGSESDMWVHSWSYVVDGRDQVVGYAYPPILLWIGFVVFLASTNNRSATDHRGVALRKAWGKGDGKARRAAYPAANGNLRRQLHERRHPYLFLGRMYVQLTSWLVGAGLVLVTALLAPATVDLTSGERIDAAQEGILPTVCLVASVIALVGLLLALPYGPSDKVVVDAMGNVRCVGEPVPPPSVRPQPPSRAQVYAGRPPTHVREHALTGAPAGTRSAPPWPPPPPPPRPHV